MIPEFIRQQQQRAFHFLKNANIILTETEKDQIEICDYDLGEFDSIGTSIVIYHNDERYCAKELIMFPKQICPEHYHPPICDYPGKRETFRCRNGEVYLYVSGEPVLHPKASIPNARKENFKVWNEIILRPGEQFTIMEGVPHWFQAGPDGAIISEFSSPSFDNKDVFTDPDIKRISNI